MSDRAPIPRDLENDYTREMVERRAEFLREKTGTALNHVRRASFDPGVLPGNIENFIGVAQVPIGLAGPLRINGEHAKGDFYVPLATTEGTLVASYSRGMRVLAECGGVTATVVKRSMQRAPVFMFGTAREARDFGEWLTQRFDDVKQAAEATTRSGRLVEIEQYAIGNLLYLRFNYTTGDAAGQNMTGKATHAACEWIHATHPARPKYMLSGSIDTDKKHSAINTLRTRGRRVVAEAVIQNDVLQRLMRVDTRTLFKARQVSNAGALLAGTAYNGPHAANGTGRRQRRGVARGHHLRAAARQRRLLLVRDADLADRRDLRRRHRPADAARVPGTARLLRQWQGRQARRDRRRRGARGRHLARQRGARRRLGDEPREAGPQPALRAVTARATGTGTPRRSPAARRPASCWSGRCRARSRRRRS
jgi:hydroxymethylglutaryl-CoA reductase (NADPH)